MDAWSIRKARRSGRKQCPSGQCARKHDAALADAQPTTKPIRRELTYASQSGASASTPRFLRKTKRLVWVPDEARYPASHGTTTVLACCGRLWRVALRASNTADCLPSSACGGRHEAKRRLPGAAPVGSCARDRGPARLACCDARSACREPAAAGDARSGAACVRQLRRRPRLTCQG
jgi:hypothetical protein